MWASRHQLMELVTVARAAARPRGGIPTLVGIRACALASGCTASKLSATEVPLRSIQTYCRIPPPRGALRLASIEPRLWIALFIAISFIPLADSRGHTQHIRREALARAPITLTRTRPVSSAIMASSDMGERFIKSHTTRRHARGVIDPAQVHRAIALNPASLMARASELLETVSFTDWKTWAVIGPACWVAFVLAVFFGRPLWLLSWDEALKEQVLLKTKLLGTELSPGISLSYAFLIRPLVYRRRVLDAWVRAHVEEFRKNVTSLPTVKEREIHVPAPIRIDGSLVTEFSAGVIRAHFDRGGRQCRWLIFGEGGSGKTSLACQVARWAMAPRQTDRVARHLILPVIIEDELDDTAFPAGVQRFTEAVRGKLQALCSSADPISPALLNKLLRRSRILVIIDHLTEMSQATRDQIRFDSPEFPAAALVVTARTEAALGNIPRHTIEPVRIDGKRLSAFIDAYLSERRTRDGLKARDLFDDEEYFEACKQLSRMAGDRDITVLLAKLFADQMIAAKESQVSTGLPRTVPDLMLRYLSELNRTGSADNRIIHRDCKTVAWECLRRTYRPGSADREDVIVALRYDGDDEAGAQCRLDYMVNRLRVIQVAGSGENHIRFVLDPLAEYLAARRTAGCGRQPGKGGSAKMGGVPKKIRRHARRARNRSRLPAGSAGLLPVYAFTGSRVRSRRVE